MGLSRLTWLGLGTMASLLGAVVLTAFLLEGFPGSGGGDQGVPSSPTEVISVAGKGGSSSTSARSGAAGQTTQPGQPSGPNGPLPGAGGRSPLDNPTIVQYGDSLQRIERSLGNPASHGG